jgi:hypothetical protein
MSHLFFKGILPNTLVLGGGALLCFKHGPYDWRLRRDLVKEPYITALTRYSLGGPNLPFHGTDEIIKLHEQKLNNFISDLDGIKQIGNTFSKIIPNIHLAILGGALVNGFIVSVGKDIDPGLTYIIAWSPSWFTSLSILSN